MTKTELKVRAAAALHGIKVEFPVRHPLQSGLHIELRNGPAVSYCENWHEALKELTNTEDLDWLLGKGLPS